MQEEKIFKNSSHSIPQLGKHVGDQSLPTSIQVNQESLGYKSAFAFYY